MRRPIGFQTGLALSLINMILVVSPSFAAPITYTEKATASGSLGGVGFTDADVVFSMTGDTTNVRNVTDLSGEIIDSNLGTVTVSVAGAPPAAFTDGGAVFYNHGVGAFPPTIGFSNDVAFFYISSVSASGYDLRTSIGPLSGLAHIFPGVFLDTTAGSFILTSVSSNATFTASTFATSLVTAVLPVSRSVQVNGTATAFATIINTGTTTATACSIAPSSTLPLTFHYQTTNPNTNAVTGTLDTPVDIPANASQSFVIALTPTAAIAPTNVAFNFICTNTPPAPVVTGLTTLLLSGSTGLTPDVVALSATATGDGILHVPGSAGTGAFATASVNVGASGAITGSANTGSATLPLRLTICQSNPANGQCLATPAATVTTTINANATPTFSIFATASGAISFDPANSRIFVVFTDSTNAVRGETSVAVQTQ